MIIDFLLFLQRCPAALTATTQTVLPPAPPPAPTSSPSSATFPPPPVSRAANVTLASSSVTASVFPCTNVAAWVQMESTMR